MSGAIEFHAELPRSTSGEMTAEFVQVMRAFGSDFISDFIRSNLSGRNGAGDGLNRRSGLLANAWNAATATKGSEIETRVWVSGPATEYAKIHEFGGVIRPKDAQNLWIPTKANQTPAGVARISPREAIARGGFISWKRGPVFFAKPLVRTAKRDKTHGLVALFILKKSVTIRPRMGATTAFRRKFEMAERALAFVAGRAFG